MEMKLVAIQSEIDMIRELEITARDRVRNDITNIVTELIANKCEGTCVAADIYDHGKEPRITFHIEFFNQEEDRYDFGSDIWFEYTKSQGLSINYGTIGYFTKQAVYQFKRIKCLNIVGDNIKNIETALYRIADTTSDYFSYQQQRYTLQVEERKIKDSLRQQKCDTLLASLSVGDAVSYVPASDGRFNCRRLFMGDNFKIGKINPKTIRVDNEYTSKSIEKELFITHIYQGHIAVNGECIND